MFIKCKCFITFDKILTKAAAMVTYKTVYIRT